MANSKGKEPASNGESSSSSSGGASSASTGQKRSADVAFGVGSASASTLPASDSSGASPSTLAESTSPPDLASPQKKMVIVAVGEGEEKVEFSVFKEYICHWSDEFRAMFASIEDQPGLFLPDETPRAFYEKNTPAAFGLFQRWMLSQTIKDLTGALPPTPDMVRLFVLADDTRIPRLANAAIRGLFEANWCGNDFEEYNYIYDNVRGGSPLRKLLVYQILRLVPKETLREALTRYKNRVPIQLIIDVAIEQSKSMPDMSQRKYTKVVEEFLIRRGI
ncbi:hypothetical protein B0J14DRAFT_648278 [Halenospora varia]|nr:hypothetical protein B0J14DRAFT_648278 [Halenospora varia]